MYRKQGVEKRGGDGWWNKSTQTGSQTYVPWVMFCIILLKPHLNQNIKYIYYLLLCKSAFMGNFLVRYTVCICIRE